MAKQVKLADIATKLKVSTVTVSKALSGQKGVSEELRLEIKKLAADMGYISPSVAKQQAEKKSYNIGVIVSENYFDHTHSFYWMMYQELATRASSENWFTMLEVVSQEDEDRSVLPKLLEQDRIDGLIIVGIMKQDFLNRISACSNVPVIYMDFYTKDRGCDAVITDNYFGMYQLVDYLCELGHKKIAYVGTLFATNSITDRYFGYCKALCEHRIESRRDYVIDDRPLGYGGVDGFEIKLPDDMPTAFACNCDVTAQKLIALLNERGLRVPEDISVVGFDNYVFGTNQQVEITTYAVDVVEMAKCAVEILSKRLNGESARSGVNVVEGRMLIKDSAARAQAY